MSSVPSEPQWKCLVCHRMMQAYGPHSKLKSHLDAVERYEARLAAENVMVAGTNQENSALNNLSPTPQADILDSDSDRELSERPEEPPSPLSYLRAFELYAENEDSHSQDSDLEIDVHKLGEAIQAMDGDEWGPADEGKDEASLQDDLRTGLVADCSKWYPFQKKEHVVALLIIGSTRSILSRLQYHCIRSILQICNVRLPEWQALRALSNRLKKNLGLHIVTMPEMARGFFKRPSCSNGVLAWKALVHL
ncbi:hypothetical protein DFH28DRAFT_1083244 [Melampsora americana]|nr:hypothetical protein DFH28DRAFT_1083244 [Melampsora americana]